MCGCKQGTCPGNCACGCTHTPPIEQATPWQRTVTREQSIAWLQPMLDEFGININAVIGVRFDPDRIVVTCVYSPTPHEKWPPSFQVEDQPGSDAFTILEYRAEAKIIDVEAKS